VTALPAPVPLAALALVAGLLAGACEASALLLAPLLLLEVALPATRVAARALLLGLLLSRSTEHDFAQTGVPEGGTTASVTGEVVRVEPPPGGGVRVLFDAETAGIGAEERAWRLRLDVDLDGPGFPVLRPGDRVRLAVRLRTVPGPKVPGGPDPRRWARVRGVRAWGRVEHPRAVEVLARATGPGAAIATWRRGVAHALTTCLDAEDAGLARALLLGDRGGVTEGDRERFRAAGQAHLVAVSGQHVALVLAAVLLVTRRLGAGASAAALLGLLAVAVYVPLTGSPPSAVRSGLGASLWLLGRLFLRQPSGLPLLAAAALVMLVLAPTDLLDPGFTLSFGAVLGIELLAPRFVERLVPDAPVLPGLLPHRPARLRRLFAVALAAWLGSAGLALYLVGQVSFVAAPLSVPAVPLTAALLACAALAAATASVPWLAAAPAWLFARTADVLRALLEVPPDLGLGTVTVEPPDALWLALSLGTLLVAGLGPPRLFRWALLAQALLFAWAV
jgi:competence protein ComEC